MTDDFEQYIPFSQREGMVPVPPQLKLGEVSDQLRHLLWYYTSLEIDRETYYGYSERVFNKGWQRVATDFHVVFLMRSINEFSHEVSRTAEQIASRMERADMLALFDLVEFLVRHNGTSDELKRELASAFATSRAAYRIFDNSFIAAIGTDQQAKAFCQSVSDAEARNAVAPRKHLIAAGVALRNSDWAGTVRESIHAVEGTVLILAPGSRNLKDALVVLEKQGHLHGGLKAAFGSLYGYSSDEKGVRHALVFGNQARVDEADALFMLGACASFVSYLLARRQLRA